MKYSLIWQVMLLLGRHSFTPERRVECWKGSIVLSSLSVHRVVEQRGTAA